MCAYHACVKNMYIRSCLPVRLRDDRAHPLIRHSQPLKYECRPPNYQRIAVPCREYCLCRHRMRGRYFTPSSGLGIMNEERLILCMMLIPPRVTDIAPPWRRQVGKVSLPQSLKIPAPRYLCEFIVHVCSFLGNQLPCDDYLKPIYPCAGRTRNSGETVASRGHQGMSLLFVRDRNQPSVGEMTHPEPPLALPKTPDLRPVLVKISMPSIQRPART